jgi:uncharacterized protein (TIGR00251 family)
VAKELEARIEVRVRPQAKLSRITGVLGAAYKIDISAPATDGRANEACIDFLAKVTRVHRANIKLMKGQSNRSKVFEFSGIDIQELRRRLDQAR